MTGHRNAVMTEVISGHGDLVITSVMTGDCSWLIMTRHDWS